MTRLRPEQIAAVCRIDGCPESQLQTFISIVLAESGGNPEATNNNKNGTTDYGLFQINSIHNPTAVNWKDPLVNGRLAAKVSENWTNPKPWMSYPLRSTGYIPTAITGIELLNQQLRSGHTLQQVYGATTAPPGSGTHLGIDIPGVDVPNPVKGIENTVDAAGELLNIFKFIFDPGNLKRAAYVVFGLIVCLYGAWTLIKSTPAFKQVKGQAIRAAEAVATDGASEVV